MAQKSFQLSLLIPKFPVLSKTACPTNVFTHAFYRHRLPGFSIMSALTVRVLLLIRVRRTENYSTMMSFHHKRTASFVGFRMKSEMYAFPTQFNVLISKMTFEVYLPILQRLFHVYIKHNPTTVLQVRLNHCNRPINSVSQCLYSFSQRKIVLVSSSAQRYFYLFIYILIYLDDRLWLQFSLLMNAYTCSDIATATD